MRKKIKIFIILLLPILLTGCTVDYRLHINFNGTLSDSVVIKETKENFEKLGFDMEEYSKEQYQIHVDNNFYHHYRKKYLVLENEARFSGEHYNWSLDDFNYSSLFVKSAFDKIEIINKNNKMILKATGNHIERMFDFTDDYPHFFYDNINLIITSDYPVLKSNADEVNKFKNEYIWHFDPKNCDKDIYLEMDSTQNIWNKLVANFRNNFIGIVLLIVLFVIIGVGGFFFYRMYRTVNDI